jgi:hypothetical protein
MFPSSSDVEKLLCVCRIEADIAAAAAMPLPDEDDENIMD